jgi:opacity protein-like surface antigen
MFTREVQMRILVGVHVILMLCLTLDGASAAQAPTGGPQVSGVIGGSFAEGRNARAEAVAAGYRFTRALSLEVEVGHLPNLGFDVGPGRPAGCFLPPSSDCSAYVGQSGGRAVTFLTNIVIHAPRHTSRLKPYILAGGGIANVRQSIRFPRCSSWVHCIAFDRSQNVLAVAAGGGVAYRIWRGLELGMDARYLRLFTEAFPAVLDDPYRIPEPVGVVRFATTVRYRF